VLKTLTNVLTNEDGATLVEYGLVVALIAVVAIASVTLLGKTITGIFTNINTKIAPAG
jgi:pilus assembly protein Flp/PilA